MTDDANLNYYLGELQNIIDQIYEVRDEINNNMLGLGEQKSIASLDFIATCYTNIKNNVVRNYYIDKGF